MQRSHFLSGCPVQVKEVSSALLLSSSPCRTMAAHLRHDSSNLILIKSSNNAGSRCCTRDHAGAQFGRKWLLSAASESVPKVFASQQLPKNTHAHAPPPPTTPALRKERRGKPEESSQLVQIIQVVNLTMTSDSGITELRVWNAISSWRCRMNDSKTTVVHVESWHRYCGFIGGIS